MMCPGEEEEGSQYCPHLFVQQAENHQNARSILASSGEHFHPKHTQKINFFGFQIIQVEAPQLRRREFCQRLNKEKVVVTGQGAGIKDGAWPLFMGVWSNNNRQLVQQSPNNDAPSAGHPTPGGGGEVSQCLSLAGTPNWAVTPWGCLRYRWPSSILLLEVFFWGCFGIWNFLLDFFLIWVGNNIFPVVCIVFHGSALQLDGPYGKCSFLISETKTCLILQNAS